jgi:hypothetical protein
MLVRFPSLKASNRITLRARLVFSGQTLVVNPVIVSMFAGDFDGDDGNVKTPDSNHSRAEVDTLMDLRAHALSMQNSATDASLLQTGLAGLWLLTSPQCRLTKRQLMRFLSAGARVDPRDAYSWVWSAPDPLPMNNIQAQQQDAARCDAEEEQQQQEADVAMIDSRDIENALGSLQAVVMSNTLQNVRQALDTTPTWTGSEALSMLLPRIPYYVRDAADSIACVVRGEQVRVINGLWQQGRATSRILGKGSPRSLLSYIARYLPRKRFVGVLGLLQAAGCHVVEMCGMSLGLDELHAPGRRIQLRSRKQQLLAQFAQNGRVDALVAGWQTLWNEWQMHPTMQALLMAGTLDATTIENLIAQLPDPIVDGQVVRQWLTQHRSTAPPPLTELAPSVMTTLIESGARSDRAALYEMTLASGNKMTPLHFPHVGLTNVPVVQGVIASSLLEGRNELESFLASADAIQGARQTAKWTPVHGADSRAFNSFLESTHVNADGTVRTAGGAIIAFHAGGDGMDPRRALPVAIPGLGERTLPLDAVELFYSTRANLQPWGVLGAVVVSEERFRRVMHRFIDVFAAPEPLVPTSVKLQWCLATSDADPNLYDPNEECVEQWREWRQRYPAPVGNLCLHLQDATNKLAMSTNLPTETVLRAWLERMIKAYRIGLFARGTPIGIAAGLCIGEKQVQSALHAHKHKTMKNASMLDGLPDVHSVIRAVQALPRPTVDATISSSMEMLCFQWQRVRLSDWGVRCSVVDRTDRWVRCMDAWWRGATAWRDGQRYRDLTQRGGRLASMVLRLELSALPLDLRVRHVARFVREMATRAARRVPLHVLLRSPTHPNEQRAWDVVDEEPLDIEDNWRELTSDRLTTEQPYVAYLLLRLPDGYDEREEDRSRLRAYWQRDMFTMTHECLAGWNDVERVVPVEGTGGQLLRLFGTPKTPFRRLSDVMNTRGVDPHGCTTTNMYDLLEVADIEAVNQRIYAMFVAQSQSTGKYVDPRWLQFAADALTFDGSFDGFTRFSHVFQKHMGPFQKMAFEQSLRNAATEAFFNNVDPIRDSTAASLTCNVAGLGTGAFALKLDREMMKEARPQPGCAHVPPTAPPGSFFHTTYALASMDDDAERKQDGATMDLPNITWQLTPPHQQQQGDVVPYSPSRPDFDPAADDDVVMSPVYEPSSSSSSPYPFDLYGSMDHRMDE